MILGPSKGIVEPFFFQQLYWVNADNKYQELYKRLPIILQSDLSKKPEAY